MSKYWIRPEDGARGTLLLISPEHALRGGRAGHIAPYIS